MCTFGPSFVLFFILLCLFVCLFFCVRVFECLSIFSNIQLRQLNKLFFDVSSSCFFYSLRSRWVKNYKTADSNWKESQHILKMYGKILDDGIFFQMGPLFQTFFKFRDNRETCKFPATPLAIFLNCRYAIFKAGFSTHHW